MDNLVILLLELEKLEEELDCVIVFEFVEMLEDVVIMNFMVCFKFLGSDEVMEKILVYLNDVKSSVDVLIFVFVGSVLFGLVVG